MTAQNPAKHHPFEVHKNGQVPTHAMNDFEASEAELKLREENLGKELERLAQDRQINNQLIRQQKAERRDVLIREAANLRELEDKYRREPDVAIDYNRRAKAAEVEAAQLAVELGIVEKAIGPQPIRTSVLLSSTKALGIVGGLFVACLMLTIALSVAVMKDPNNAMGQSMVMNSPLRVSLAFTLTFLTVLVGFLFLRLFFPQLYRIWHNRVETERSFDSLLQEAPAGQVLLGILGLLALFMSVFAGYYQALYV